MPQRPSWNQRYSRYCCATVRNALLTCTVATSETLTRSFFAPSWRYGSTALLVICSFALGSNLTRLAGSMHPTSSAICFDRPRTTDVEQVFDWKLPTVASEACSARLASSRAHPLC